MGRYNFLANANDAYTRTSSTSFFNAQNHSGTQEAPIFDEGPFDGVNNVDVGQKFEPSNGRTYVTEGFQEFSHSPTPDTEIVTSACYKVYGTSHVPTGDAWSLEVREQDWGGGAVTLSDIVPGADLPTKPLLAEFPGIRTKRPAPAVFRDGRAELRTRLSTGGGTSPLRVIIDSNKKHLHYAAGGTGDEFVSLGAFEDATGPYRPRIEYSTVARSTLAYVRGALVQLTDGTHVYLESDAAATSPVVTVKHDDGTTVTTVATLPTGTSLLTNFTAVPGAQTFSLARDAADNLFVVGPAASQSNGIELQGFVKGTGYTWTQKTALVSALPTYDSPPNNFALTWHDDGSTGLLIAAVGHAQGYSFTNQTMLVSLSARSALLGTGAPVVATLDVPPQRVGAPINPTGNGLDILALSGQAGVLAASAFDHTYLGEDDAVTRVWAYRLNPNGTFADFAYTTYFSHLAPGSPDADGNLVTKLVAISASRFAVLANGWVYSFAYTSGVTLTTLGQQWLNDAGLTSLGTNSAAARDAIYDAATGTVWVYYLDSADSRRVLRTGYNVATSLLGKTETQVAATQGAAGSTNVTVRLPRGAADERALLVQLGNRSGDPTPVYSTVAYRDLALDVAPNAPTLINPGTFTATSNKTLTWTFSDPNPRDAQSAYNLTIRDAGTLATVVTTGKVTSTQQSYLLPASTLSNSASYEWMVVTYDRADHLGTAPNWQAFSTVTSGIVTVTDPAADNPTGLQSQQLDVTWSFTVGGGLTQVDYRVRVIRTDTNAQVFDSGFINGPTVTTYTVSGLVSDVEQRIEVTVRDSSAAVSSTGTRLVTPSFSSPNAPTITAVPNLNDTEGSGVLVTVINPPPTGDLPPAGRNDVYRSETGQGAFIKIGEAPVDGQFTDYTAAANTSYDYKVEAVAQGATDSNTVTGVSITFLGVYLHNPVDLATAPHYFEYGDTGNSDTTEALSTELRFAGRAYPTYEFGSELDQKVSVKITVPFGDDHAAQVAFLRSVAQSRTVHCFRDGRGRKVFGVVSSVETGNSRVGTDASLTVARADFTEAVP